MNLLGNGISTSFHIAYAGLTPVLTRPTPNLSRHLSKQLAQLHSLRQAYAKLTPSYADKGILNI
eukprot:2511904-Heterocapsa_arctica.AAC.1